MNEIETQLRELRAEHRRALDSWKTFHRLKLDIETLSKILVDEKDALAQGQLMFPVEHLPKPKRSAFR